MQKIDESDSAPPVELDEDDWDIEGGPVAATSIPEHVAPGAPSRRLTVIEPTAGWRAVNFGELWANRELLYYLTWREIKVRYKQTVLGSAWAILQPVMTTLVFNLVFGTFGKMAEGVDVPYPVFLYAALLPWTFFATSVTQGALSLIQSRNMLSKIYFPRLLIPWGSVGGQSADFGISFLVMIGMMAWFRIPPTWNLLLLPLVAAGTIVAALATATLLSALSVTYRDFRYLVPFVIQLWMFACPVPYDIAKVPEKWRFWYALNPMAGMVDGFRSALLGQPIHWSILSTSLLSIGLLTLLSLAYFRRCERRFADIA